MKRLMIAGAVTAAAALSAGAVSAAQLSTYATRIDVGRTGVASTGWDAIAQTNTTSRLDAGNALGAPDSVPNVTSGFYSLGTGGAAVFDFGTTFSTAANIFEVTFGCGAVLEFGMCSNYQEEVKVYALDGAYTPFDAEFGLADLTALGFSHVGTLGNGTAHTSSGGSVMINGSFRYLALVDNSPAGEGRDGFDVDAVSVSAVPVPASVLFLVSALGGVGLLRSRRPV